MQTITLNLTNDGASPSASLTDLKWAWFDSPNLSALSAPTDVGAAESTNALGELKINLANSTLVSGQVGWLIVTNSNGSPTQSPVAGGFCGPVAID